jgi:CSLREA domain-containing protein
MHRWVLAVCAALALGVVSLLAAGPAYAETFVPNDLTDDVDRNVGNGVCRARALDIFSCTLRAAIQEANARPGRDTILLNAGTYTLDIGGSNEDAAATGDLDITDDLTIDGCDNLVGNCQIVARHGDRIFDIRPGVNVNLIGVTLSGGRAFEGALIRNQGTLAIRNSDLRNGIATLSGGAITQGNGSLYMENSIVRDNSAAADGGGIFMTSNGSGSVTLLNVTVTTNSSSARGGGIDILGGSANLTNVTVDRNSAQDEGGGVMVRNGSLAMKNTIVASNSAPAGANCRTGGAGAITSAGHNLESVRFFPLSCPFNTGLGDIIGGDPRLGDLVSAGGSIRVPTRSLLGGSAAIEAGDNVGCPATDQRGVARPQDGNGDGIFVCDIGAFEFQRPVGSVGTFALNPRNAVVKPGERLASAFTWTSPGNWHDLATLDLRVCGASDSLIWVRWDEKPNTFGLVDQTGKRTGPQVGPGSATTLETAGAILHLAQTTAVGSGPTGPSVTLTLSLSFKPAAAGRTCDVEVLGADDQGAVQGFERAGTLRVGGDAAADGQANDPNRDKEERLTEEERRQLERTNTGSEEDERVEGDVLAVSCDRSPPEVLIGNRDGRVTLRLLREAARRCGEVRPGQYLTSGDAEKQHELLYDVSDFAVR